ncbi:hypothetical protein [Nocardia sp. CC227C]|uniref:hypothetical protein n=1 Tax=Nocardia sp. CC227C TaxID=3044562 RepID=UPI00278BB235|nr:hypothetical protein [Nocardia sp. CC227C]
MFRMIDWSSLHHAYGPADDIPGMLARYTTGDGKAVTGRLQSRIYHQGSVYSASFAALEPMAEIAAGLPPGDPGRIDLLVLSGNIVAAAEPHGIDVMAAHAAEVAALARLTSETLRAGLNRYDFAYVLQAVAAFEGASDWHVVLDFLHLDELVLEEFNFSLPVCTHCEIKAPNGQWREWSFDWGQSYWQTDDLPDDDPALVPNDPALTPIDPAAFDPVLTHLYQSALDAGHRSIATKLTYLFGSFDCPDCGRPLSIAELLVR